MDRDTQWTESTGVTFRDVAGQDEAKEYIAGIAEDENKNMWMTTANGVLNIIPSIDTKTGDYAFHYYIYDDKDGLQGAEFNQRSIKRLTSGEIAILSVPMISNIT